MLLKTENYVIKPITFTDLGADYFGWINDEEITRHLFIYRSNLTRDDVRQHLQSYDQQTSFFLGIFDKFGKMIGTHSYRAAIQHKRCALGVMIGERSYWGKNVVLEVRRAILNYAFEEDDCVKAEAGCYKNNIPAIYNFQRMGWKSEGIRRSHREVDGTREDLILFGLLRDEWYAQKKP